VPGWAEDARIAPPPISAARTPDAAPLAAARAAARSGEAGPDGALLLVTGTRLFDRGTAALRCPGIRTQAGEPFVALAPGDAGRLGITDGGLCEVRSAQGALRLAARVWPGLHPGHAYVPWGYDAAPIATLLDEGGPVSVTVRALLPAGQ
jgi:predicted molibdopterin-dependent oxidoreductase YjgC